MIDASKIQYYTGYNTYKNLGVRTARVTVSGSLASGAIGDYTAVVTLLEDYKFSTARVKTNDFRSGSTARWQAFPPATYYNVPCSAGATELAVRLLLEVNGNQVTFKATALNPNPGSITFVTTDIDFVYAVHTTAI